MTAKSFVVAMLAASGFIATPPAFAELLKVHHYYVDDDGDDDRDEWQERKRKKAKKHKHARTYGYYGYYAYERPPAAIYAPRESATRQAPSPSRSFPRESASDHAAAKDRQREVLEKELAAEQQLMADASARLDEQGVQHHARNVEALRRELRNLQR